jgi:hypothetical protein
MLIIGIAFGFSDGIAAVSWAHWRSAAINGKGVPFNLSKWMPSFAG